jgi:hypothetical protein
MFLSAAIVLRMYGPTVMLSMSSTGISVRPASSRSFSVPPVTSPSRSSVPGQLVAGLDIDRAGLLVDDVLGDVAADDVVEGHEDLGDLAFLDQLLTLRGVTFLPASAITSPVAASTMS